MVDEVENKPKFVLNKKKSDAPVPEVQDDSQKIPRLFRISKAMHLPKSRKRKRSWL